MSKFLAEITSLLGPVANSVKGRLNSTEAVRIAISTLVAGGGTVGLLTAIQAAAGTLFLNPADASLAAMLATVVLDLIRRYGHGADAK